VTSRTEHRGRPSLNGIGSSPQLRLRLPDELLDALQGRAAIDGTTVSELARRLLTEGVSLASQTAAALGQLSGPLGIRLQQRRHAVLETATRHGIKNVRVFGSVARGQDNSDSDVDLLVDLPEGMGLIGLGRARADLERVLDAPVDLVPAGDLKGDVARSVAAEVVAL
jgi:predicted nucleotidyltransferase